MISAMLQGRRLLVVTLMEGGPHASVACEALRCDVSYRRIARQLCRAHRDQGATTILFVVEKDESLPLVDRRAQTLRD